jgi:TolB-like protein/DNA-binding winged helix-turn-helix (wHTH) protein/Tfp pilus assembly protein PilF
MEERSYTQQILHFGQFEFDQETGELRRRGLQVKIAGQPVQILAMLLEHPGQVIAREQIEKKLWPADTFVEFEQSLNAAVKRLREALGESAENPRYIETLPRRGYRFIAPVTVGGLEPRGSIAQEGGPSAPPLAESMRAAGTERPQTLPYARQSDGGAAVPSKLRSPMQWTRPGLVAAAGVLLVVTGVVWFTWHRSRVQSGFSTPKRIQSLAVLPLQNLSSDKEQEYFVDGMTDQLITGLAKIGSLRVISRTSAMRYKGTGKALDQIGRELKVDAVVEGTVLRSGNRVRITAQLIRAMPEQHLWSESYEGDLRDVLALQGDVARAIAHEIRIKLSAHEQALLERKRPVNPEAYEMYLKGSYFSNKRTEEGLKKGREYFQRAVDTEPSYALAYAGLANSYDLLGAYSLFPAQEVFPKAEAAARKALTVDNSLAEAHTALGYAILFFDWNWAAAEREFRQSIRLNANSATAHEYYALYFDTLGQIKEAISEMERARELDPLSLDINAQLGVVYRDGRYYDQAIEQCRKTVELDQHFSPGHWCLGMAYTAKKMYKEATDEFLKARASGGCPCELAALGYAYAAAGDKISASSILRELERRSEQGSPLSYLIAEVYAGLGENDRAFTWLDRAYKERDFNLPAWLKLDPMMDSLRSDPRLTDLVRRVGLPE